MRNYPPASPAALLILLAGPMFVAAASGQSLVPADELLAVKRIFDESGAGTPLRCAVHPVRPALDYDFRFSTGFTLDIPLAQLAGLAHSLEIYIRVVPEGRPPVYLSEKAELPEVPKTKAEAELGGTFVLGEGTYRADVVLQDERHRSCHGTWPIEVRRTGSERQLKATTPGGSVEEVAGSSLAVSAANAGPQIARLTVLLNAAPLSPKLSKLQPKDVETLVNSLLSLMRELPAQSVHLIAFNLEQRSVVFKKDDFEAGQKGDLAAALNQMNLGMVDYRTLRQSQPPVSLLSNLIAAELDAHNPPDGLVVLGPRTRIISDVPPGTAGRASGVATPIFSLQLLPARDVQQLANQLFRRDPPRVTRATDPDPSLNTAGADGKPMAGPEDLAPTLDVIQRLVAHFKGESIAVRSPHDLAEALRRMDARIAKTATSSLRDVEPPSKRQAPVPAPATPPPPPISLPPPVPAQEPSATANAGLAIPGSEVLPTGDEDPVEVLMKFRDEVLKHGELIPNHTCVETIKRDRFEPTAGRAPKSCATLLDARQQSDAAAKLKLDSTDWLRLDVAYSTNREIYSWAGANKFEEGEIDELIPNGAVGTGAFGSLLLSMFSRRDQRFMFLGETSLDGRRVFEYSFAVAKPVSSYRFRAHKEWFVTGYSGNVFIDPATAKIARLLVRTDELPPASDTCETDTTLDYGVVKLEGNDYLLPTVARQRFIGREGGEAENRMTFSACRQFQAESRLAFGEAGSGGPARSDSVSNLASLAAGVPVSVELVKPIRIGDAAAGDRIEGKLAKPLRDGQRTLAAAGTLVQGRIMRVETTYAPQVEHAVSLRWDRVEIDGVMTPLNLTPNRRPTAPVAVSGPKELKRRGVEIVLPMPGEGKYAVVHLNADHPVVDSGYQSEWLTAKP